jgi:hypothetical protein
MEIECGFLTYHPPMPHFPTIVRYKGQWMPEALVTHGDHKRFSDAELAAELWFAVEGRTNNAANIMSGNNYKNPYAQKAFQRAIDIAKAAHRFAEAPHFDE